MGGRAKLLSLISILFVAQGAIGMTVGSAALSSGDGASTQPTVPVEMAAQIESPTLPHGVANAPNEDERKARDAATVQGRLTASADQPAASTPRSDATVVGGQDEIEVQSPSGAEPADPNADEVAPAPQESPADRTPSMRDTHLASSSLPDASSAAKQPDSEAGFAADEPQQAPGDRRADESIEVEDLSANGELSQIRPDEVEHSAPPPILLVPGHGPVQVFPLLGGGSFSSSFGAPRDGGARQHEGNDIFAPKLTPVVAVAPGTVVAAPSGIGEKCCYLKIEHADGSQSVYLHLNNDTPGTDDGQGWGVAEGIAVGTYVEAGQIIGFVGDSGNAEDTESHLHFEYRVAGTGAVDPYLMLMSAPVLAEAGGITLAAANSGPVTELPYTGADIQALVFWGLIMLAAGALLIWSPLIGSPRTRQSERRG